MSNKQYKTPHALLMAINDHLRAISEKEQIVIDRLRRQLAFDRLLNRLFKIKKCPWVLKGGYAMELRMQCARATKDIDLAMSKHSIPPKDSSEQTSAIHERLVSVAAFDLNDFFIFEISQASTPLLNPPEGGVRFLVNSLLDGKTFAKFRIDIGVGDVHILPLEKLESRDWLGFAGIQNISFPAISKEQQFAEKFHAYARFGRDSSRVKDLVDMILLIQTGNMSKAKVKESIKKVFQAHNVPEIPTKIFSPPPSWPRRFSKLADECKIDITIKEAFQELVSFYSQVKID